ncbi:MAG TPA: hypothetical protein VFS40_08065 [Gemmatimonadales bacterium]|nr:hypothetical protein [Gemmatimonadales bacterium]
MVPFDDFFAGFAELIRTASAPHGFVPAEEAVAVGRFGSRMATFRRGGELLQLVWDGREHWLAFEFRPMPEYSPAIEWTGLLNDRFDGRQISPDDEQRLRAGLEDVLAQVWRRRAIGTAAGHPASR